MEWNKTLTRQEKNLNTNSCNLGSKELGHGQGNVASLKHNWTNCRYFTEYFLDQLSVKIVKYVYILPEKRLTTQRHFARRPHLLLKPNPRPPQSILYPNLSKSENWKAVNVSLCCESQLFHCTSWTCTCTWTCTTWIHWPVNIVHLPLIVGPTQSIDSITIIIATTMYFPKSPLPWTHLW